MADDQTPQPNTVIPMEVIIQRLGLKELEIVQLQTRIQQLEAAAANALAVVPDTSPPAKT